MMAKGTYASIMLATNDLDALFERVQASGADVMQEPTDPGVPVTARSAIPRKTPSVYRK